MSSRDAGRLLSFQRDPDITLEGARLLLNAGGIDEVAGLLEKWSELLIDEGYGPRLWQRLELSSDDRLSRWRLRCAVALCCRAGGGAVRWRCAVALCGGAGSARPPGEAEAPQRSWDPEARLLWARGPSCRGDGPRR